MSEIKQSTKKFQFSIAALNDVLTQTKSVKKKLSPFLARFQKHQMSEIFDTFSHLHKNMATPKSNLTYKFNSLFALKVLLDNSDYVLVNWIEIFFLPHIIEIAKYYLANNGEGKNYFYSLGYSAEDDAGIQKMGFNYVLLAVQLIQVGAKVKPYRLFQSSYLDDQSDFALALQQLVKSGFKPTEKLSFYPKKQVLDAQIAKYQQNLSKLSDEFIDIYSQFSNAKVYQYLEEQHGLLNQKYDINIVQVLESGDLFLSSPAIQICKGEIKQPQSLNSFKNALNVLHRLLLNADYEAFFVLNFEDTLKQSIFEVLECDKNDKAIKRGLKFLSKFKNPQESKRIYTLYLSNLQKWSVFTSVYAKENENLLKKVVTCLKQNLGIEFPSVQNFQLQKKKFQSLRERNLQRNLQLAEEIEKKPSALEEVLKKLKQQSSKMFASQIKPVTQQKIIPSKVSISSMNNINTPAPPSGRNEILPFAKRLNYIEEVLHKFPKDSQNYQKNKVILLDFSSNFEQQLLTVPQNVFDQFSQRAFGLQKDIQDAIKLGEKNKQITVQKQVKIQQKVQVRQIVSEVFDQSSKSHKSIPKQQQVRQSKKQIRQPIIDTPVKKFDFEESLQKNDEKFQVQDLGYKIADNVPVVNKSVQKKQQNITKTIQKLGYQYQQQHQQKQQSFSVSQVEPKNKLGYEFLQDSNKQKEYNHPLDYGYHKAEQQPIQNSRLSNKQQSRSQQILSNRSIRKTEELSQSRKKFEQSSIKSNSKVEHFSPQSSVINNTRQYEKSDFKKKNYEIHEEELDIPLEQNLNQNTSVNRPKQFKSLSANREIKSRISEHQHIQISPQKFQQEYPVYQKKPNQQPSEPVLAFSSTSSPLNISTSPNKATKPYFIEDHDLQEEDLLDQDQICPSHLNPLQESFHDINELQHKIKSNIVSDSANQRELSFKNCFETDKYILQRQEQKKNKLYWLQSDSTNLVKNILLKKQKNKYSKINIPQLLNQKNVKHQSQIKAVQQEKNTKIKQLQGKIKNLQKESEFMKTQLTYQNEEIKTLKATSQYDKESVGQKGYLQDMENITAQKRSSPNKFAFSASRGFKIGTSNVRQNVYLDPKGKLINSKVYKQYFQKFRRQKDKKMVLKSKDLLHKDKDIEIGFMSKKQGQKLLITIFVTPQKDLQALDWTITESEGLQIESQPNGFVELIRAKKQEKILFTIQVKRIYFTLPQIEFIYTIQQQRQVTKIILPCSFHKFFFIKESDGDFDQWFKANEKIIRGEEVPYSKRLLKSFDNLREYFQCMTVLNKGAPNSQGEICYGGFATYKNIQFPIRVCIKPNQFLYIQGVNESRDSNGESVTVIQYYISLLTHLLMKEID